MHVYLYWICGAIVTVCAIFTVGLWALGVAPPRDALGFTLMAIGMWIATP